MFDDNKTSVREDFSNYVATFAHIISNLPLFVRTSAHVHYANKSLTRITKFHNGSFILPLFVNFSLGLLTVYLQLYSEIFFSIKFWPDMPDNFLMIEIYVYLCLSIKVLSQVSSSLFPHILYEIHSAKVDKSSKLGTFHRHTIYIFDLCLYDANVAKNLSNGIMPNNNKSLYIRLDVHPWKHRFNCSETQWKHDKPYWVECLPCQQNSIITYFIRLWTTWKWTEVKITIVSSDAFIEYISWLKILRIV